jgi:hypothetical protein
MDCIVVKIHLDEWPRFTDKLDKKPDEWQVQYDEMWAINFD